MFYLKQAKLEFVLNCRTLGRLQDFAGLFYSDFKTGICFTDSMIWFQVEKSCKVLQKPKSPAFWLQKVQLLEKKLRQKNGVKHCLTDATKSSFGYKTRFSWRLKYESNRR